MWQRIGSVIAGLLLWCSTTSWSRGEQSLQLALRYQQPTSEGSGRYHRLERNEQWQASQTAVIICDLWDSHHSVNAVRRVAELAPRIDTFVKALREKGATVIHAPSECMKHYADHPARLRAMQIPQAGTLPPDITDWCDQIPAEQQAAYPLDQSDGGEDDDPAELISWAQQLRQQGRNPRAPWLSQTDVVQIDDQRDFISDSGIEVWSILASRKVTKVMLVGVHTNMCVLGRPFGLRRLATAGLNVVLVRDLTDTMYNPRSWPYANHFTGTDIMVSHIERWVCPTISSQQILSGNEFRFSKDHRPQLTMLIADDEYQTERTLPEFAARHLSGSFRVTIAYGSETKRHSIVSLDDVRTADVLLISARRRLLPEADLQLIKQFVRSGRPMIGIRTASHAFSLRRGTPESGLADWPELDTQVWGGNYTNHYGNDLQAELSLAQSAAAHPIVRALGGALTMRPGGSLYKTAPLAPGTMLLMTGQVPNEPPQPVAWTFVRADGGRSFYTSLGHPADFDQVQFQTLLSAGIHWACDLPLPTMELLVDQNQRYAAGQGRQRK
ncbi:MAG: isochorismatase family protein [Pirellulaceae bacterium]|nr:isochorismatase family protein [Pirellulaceae bacterium]